MATASFTSTEGKLSSPSAVRLLKATNYELHE
jgi:hypothetical protein